MLLESMLTLGRKRASTAPSSRVAVKHAVSTQLRSVHCGEASASSLLASPPPDIGGECPPSAAPLPGRWHAENRRRASAPATVPGRSDDPAPPCVLPPVTGQARGRPRTPG